jgi:hypothetical protein
MAGARTGQASQGGGGLGQGRTGAAADSGGFATGVGVGGVGRAREAGRATGVVKPTLLRTIFFSSSHLLAVEKFRETFSFL